MVMFILPSLCHFFLSFEARKPRVLGLSRRWRWRWRWTCSCRCSLKCGRPALDSLFVLLLQATASLLTGHAHGRQRSASGSGYEYSSAFSPLLGSLLFSQSHSQYRNSVLYRINGVQQSQPNTSFAVVLHSATSSLSPQRLISSLLSTTPICPFHLPSIPISPQLTHTNPSQPQPHSNHPR